jgi:oligosaccharide reducing-end xylanase
MSMVRSLVLTAAVTLAMAAGARARVAAENLIANGGFEADGAGWNLFLNNPSTASAAATYPTIGAEEGSRFCRITVTAISNNASDNWFIQLQDPDWVAKQGVEYRLTFWAKADGPHGIQVAVAGDSASPYTYRAGTELTLGATWKQYEIYRKSDVAGAGRMSFNFYCGYATGVYDFDNVALTEYATTLPAVMALPAQSAWQSGVHRNLFTEMGHTQAEVDAKVAASFQQLFFGDRNTEAVYTPVGADLGYINTPNSGSIITEGQSYGMIIAVMLNRQDVFDRLWRFAKTYMQHASGDRKGYFSWNVSETAPYAMNDPNPAPDGEEYFATSLLFAAKRWGNGAGILDYQAQADSLLTEMRHKPANASVIPMIEPAHSMIVFSPTTGWNPTITDASYQLPGFYSIWSRYATVDKDFWAVMADSSRAFFKRACHPTTGLMSDLQNWDGTPYLGSAFPQSRYYKSDAWRTAMNIGFDYAWFKADPWETEQSVRLLKFFDAQGDYKQRYAIDGTVVPEDDGSSIYSASGAQIACNAVSALASNDPVGWIFVEAFWKQSVPSGTYRYYSGLLHMLGLLHCSGKFALYGNPALGIAPRAMQKSLGVDRSDARGIDLFDLNGRFITGYPAGLDAGKRKVSQRFYLPVPAHRK